MATVVAAQALVDSITNVNEYGSKKLLERPEWGAINFTAAHSDVDRIFSVLNHLQILPLEYLPDTTVVQIGNEINEVQKLFEQVDSFEIQSLQNPTQTRDKLVAELHTRADQFYTVVTPWIPFLAYQKGDVAKNIQSLTTSVTDANDLVEQAKDSIKAKEGEIDNIIVQAREASAGAGAAVFTKDFKTEATALEKTANNWLWVTGLLAVITLILALVMYFTIEAGMDYFQALQKFGSKLAALGVLIAATVWCGRIYKAIMHQAAVNKHRALSLQTFQAFSHAASDEATKDAVLMEATRAIFSTGLTGYIEQKSDSSESNSTRIVEVARAFPKMTESS